MNCLQTCSDSGVAGIECDTIIVRYNREYYVVKSL